jgi:hypothetical protein
MLCGRFERNRHDGLSSWIFTSPVLIPQVPRLSVKESMVKPARVFLRLGVTLEYTEIDAARRAIGLNVQLPLCISPETPRCIGTHSVGSYPA